jgi:hypothetical protein
VRIRDCMANVPLQPTIVLCGACQASLTRFQSTHLPFETNAHRTVYFSGKRIRKIFRCSLGGLNPQCPSKYGLDVEREEVRHTDRLVCQQQQFLMSPIPQLNWSSFRKQKNFNVNSSCCTNDGLRASLKIIIMQIYATDVMPVEVSC